MEILRFKRERVLFCFSDLSGGSVKKVYQIFSNLVYFCRFSFQFNLEKHKGGCWFGCFGFLLNSPYNLRVTQYSKMGCEL